MEAVEVRDFRPINLVSDVYKIIAKVLANRFKIVLDDIISKTRNAFIRYRQIFDYLLIANECLDSGLKLASWEFCPNWTSRKLMTMLSEIFLLYMLRRCHFGEKWQRWIAHCISIIRFSILCNGMLNGCFNSFRGLRQGDPLSPLLFVITMEAMFLLVCAEHE